MTCPDCEFVHELSRDLIKEIVRISREKGELEGIAAQNKVWASIEASRKIRRLQQQLGEASGESLESGEISLTRLRTHGN